MVVSTETTELRNKISKLETLTTKMCKQMDMQNTMIRSLTLKLNRLKYTNNDIITQKTKWTSSFYK